MALSSLQVFFQHNRNRRGVEKAAEGLVATVMQELFAASLGFPHVVTVYNHQTLVELFLPDG